MFCGIGAMQHGTKAPEMENKFDILCHIHELFFTSGALLILAKHFGLVEGVIIQTFWFCIVQPKC